MFFSNRNCHISKHVQDIHLRTETAKGNHKLAEALAVIVSQKMYKSPYMDSDP